MRISELIKHLEITKAQYGDLPLTTYDGFISRVKFTAAKDGICHPLAKGGQNEVGIEIETEQPDPR